MKNDWISFARYLQMIEPKWCPAQQSSHCTTPQGAATWRI